MLHTVSHTFWSLQLMSAETTVQVFSVRSLIVRWHTLYTAILDDSREKIYSGKRSGYLGGHPLVPCAQSIAWEELYSTRLAHRQRNDVGLNPAKVLVEPTPCSFHYSSDRSLNNEDICRRPLQFRQISQQLRYLSTPTAVPTDLSTMKISVDAHYSSDRSLNNEDICRRPLHFRQISKKWRYLSTPTTVPTDLLTAYVCRRPLLLPRTAVSRQCFCVSSTTRLCLC